MRRWLTSILILFIAARAFGVDADNKTEPRVLIVSIDGCRPDVLLRADMPNVRQLMNTGAFSFWAQTTPASITLPSHTSMLTGMVIERHGITANDDKAAALQTLTAKTIFQYAHAAGITTGMAAGKSKFSILEKDVDFVWVPVESKTTDVDVANHAVELIAKHRPRLLFVHFPQNDNIGHAIGWGTPEQIAGLSVTDAQLGRVLDALKAAGVREQTTIILSADHGGRGRVHGKDDLRSFHIPWIINGPGVRENYDLTRDKDLIIRTYDTFSTACTVLGMAIPPDSDGKPVLTAFAKTELMQAAITTQPALPTNPTTPPTKTPEK